MNVHHVRCYEAEANTFLDLNRMHQRVSN